MVRTGIMRAYGSDLRRVVGVGLRNRAAALGAGIGVTVLLQSSTATALITASFIGPGLLATAQGLAVLLGADIGTTLVAQVLSLGLAPLSPLLVLIGVIAFMAGRATRIRDLGRATIGLGLILLALGMIHAASVPIRESPVLVYLLGALAGTPILSLAIAAVLTWLFHSSLAMILMLMSLAGSGTVPLEVAFVWVLGANLGGAIPPLVATAGFDREARRVPLGNLIFKSVGCLALMPFLAWLTPYLALLGAEPARQIVNLHTAFNLGLALVFVFALDPVARLCEILLPERPGSQPEGQPRYLKSAAIETPSLALAEAVRETLRVGDVIEVMLSRTLEVFRTDDRKLLRDVERMDDTVDTLYEAVKLFVTEVSRGDLDEAESRRAVEIITFTTNLEHIGDIVDKNLMELAAKKIRDRLVFSDEGWRDICALHATVVENLRLALSAFVSGDVKSARKLVENKARFGELERAAVERHWERLRHGKPESIESSPLHLDILRDLKRINSHVISVAYPVLDNAGELRPRGSNRSTRDPGAPTTVPPERRNGSQR